MRKSAKNISKIFIATTLLSCALIPAFTLTSCATISQWTLPLKIGDINNGPFSNVTATSFGYLDPQTQQSGDFSSFLPTNYISFTDRSNSGAGNQAFAYTNPEKHGTYDPNSQTQEHYPLGWYGFNDSKLNFANKDLIDSYANLFTQAACSSTVTIGANLAGIYSDMLAYCAQTGILTNPNQTDWYTKLFNNTNFHYDKNDSTANAELNKKFYEFMFDLNNLLTQGSSIFRFGQQAMNWKYASWMIGLGPMLDTIASRNIFGITDNTSQNQPKVYTFDDTTPFNCANIKSALNTNLKDPAYADFAFGHSSLAQNTDKTGYIIQSGTNFEMPVLLTPTDTSFTYYYPTKHLPFYSNNWYVTDINKVTNYVEKSNAWNNFGNYVNGTNKYDKKNYVNDLSWQLPINEYTSSTNNDYAPNNAATARWVPNNIISAIATDQQVTSPKLDPAINYLTSNNTCRDYITPQTFIAMADYQEYQYTFKDSTDNDVICTLPIFAGFDGMYPIALLWKDDGSIDGNLYAKQYPASITNAVDYTTQKEDYAFYNLDNSKLASKYANFITWLSKSINKNDQPTNINLTNLRIFQNLLNIWNANDWTNQSTTSDKIFQSI